MDREDSARRGVERDHAAHERIAEDSRDVPLQVHVDVRHQRLARFRHLIGPRHARFVHDASHGVHLDEPHALRAVQRLLVLPLEPSLADLLAHLVLHEALAVELAFADLAGIAHEGRHGLTVGVVPFRNRLDDEAGEIDPVLFEDRDDVDRGVRKNHRRPVGLAAEPLERARDVAGRELNHRAEPRELGLERVFGRAQQGHRVRRKIFRDHVVLAIVDDPAWRGQRDLAQPVLLRLQRVPLVLQHLRVEEAAQEHGHQHHDENGADPGAARYVVRMEAHAVDGSTRGRITTSSTTPASAVTAAESGDHSINCWTSSIPPTRRSARK